MPIDPSILLRGQGIQVPDFLGMMGQAEQIRNSRVHRQGTLAGLARQEQADIEAAKAAAEDARNKAIDQRRKDEEHKYGIATKKADLARKITEDSWPWLAAIPDPIARAKLLRGRLAQHDVDDPDIGDAIDDTTFEQLNKVYGKVPEIKGPTPYEMEKDKWERDFKERQLKASGANTTKDNELAAAKYELTKTKTESDLARKTVDVKEVSAQADEAVALIDQMIGTEDGTMKRHPGFKGAVGARGPSSFFGLKDKPIGGTDAAGFAALYDQVKGGAFLEAVQKMKGSGALSDTEGKAAANAITRMQLSTSEAEFEKAAKEFRTAIKNRKGRVIDKAAKSGHGPINPNDPAAVGPPATPTRDYGKEYGF